MVGDVPAPLPTPSDRRIFGLETEFGLHFRHNSARDVTPDEVAGALFADIVAWGRSTNVFLPNGSRLYIDVGAHPEYATVECDSIGDLIAFDKAGERIVGAMVAAGERRLATAGLIGDIHLYKNNTDASGNSYGCHENYLVRRRADFTTFAGRLIPFFVTRQIMTGAGCVLGTGSSARFGFSPRADHMWEAMSSATTRSRPMINTRDEPHAHADLYRRMHVIVGDSTLAEPTLLLKVGATDLLLRIAEAGRPLPDLELARDMQTIRDVARDIEGNNRHELADGRRLTAVEIQRVFLDFVRDGVGAVIERSAEVESILDLWERALQAVETGDHSLIDQELDWAIKERLFERYRARHGVALDDPRIARLELAYHDVAPGHGLYPRMVADGLIATVIRQDAIEAAMTNPPESTRGRLRGRFVQAAIDARRDFTADWVRIKVTGEDGATILLKDPFRAEDARVDRLIAELQRDRNVD